MLSSPFTLAVFATIQEDLPCDCHLRFPYYADRAVYYCLFYKGTKVGEIYLKEHWINYWDMTTRKGRTTETSYWVDLAEPNSFEKLNRVIARSIIYNQRYINPVIKP